MVKDNLTSLLEKKKEQEEKEEVEKPKEKAKPRTYEDDPWIRTFGGKEFHFKNIDPDSILLTDIAHSLSLNCRFTGHLKEFYSVAEHCLWVSVFSFNFAKAGISGKTLPMNDYEAARVSLYGLMHDAAETYVTDLNKPAKTMLPDYQELEKKVERAIFDKFKLPFEQPYIVKYADNTMLMAEAATLLKETDFSAWVQNHYNKEIVYNSIPLTPRQAEAQFLQRFASLTQIILQAPNKMKTEAAIKKAAKDLNLGGKK